MMVESVLVVCVGNICRSPVGERLLQALVPKLKVGSAGLGALVGKAADPLAAEVAAANGLSLGGHVARQFTPELAASHGLILVMEPGHRADVVRLSPHLSGRVMLFGQWTGARGIADPYRKSREFHEAVFVEIRNAAEAWASRLAR